VAQNEKKLARGRRDSFRVTDQSDAIQGTVSRNSLFGRFHHCPCGVTSLSGTEAISSTSPAGLPRQHRHEKTAVLADMEPRLGAAWKPHIEQGCCSQSGFFRDTHVVIER